MTADISLEETYSPLQEDSARSVAKATGLVALGNVSSRILGLVREIILSNLFGASAAVDAFKIATIVPRSLYDLLIGGHVNSALVPVLSDYAEHHDEQDLWELVSALLTVMVILMTSLVIFLQLAAPWVMRVVADDATPEILAQSTRLFQITAPALFFLSIFAIFSSLLYAWRQFSLPAFAGTIFNLTIVITTAALAGKIGITAAAVGWLLGAIIQAGVQLLGLRGKNIRLRLVWWHPALKTIALLYTPVMFSLAIDVLVNRPISYRLAARTGEGNISYMDWATILREFPHGLVATAISVAVLPTLSRQALSAEKLEAFKDTLGLGLRLVLALIIPSTIGLIVLATPIISLIFEHGKFTPEDTAITAFALRLYMLGLPFASIDLLLLSAFYARQDTLTPAVIGLLSLAAYMVTAVYLLPYYSFFALMIADSVKHFIHAAVLGWLLMRRIGWLKGQHLTSTLLKSTLAALIMGLLAAGLLVFLRTWFSSHTLLNEFVLVIGAGGISGLAYLGVANWLGVSEIQKLFQQIRQRL